MRVPAPATVHNRRILIVEDDAIIARDIEGMLKELDYAVPGIASSYDEAVTLAEKEPADLALMDIRLKGTADGIHAADRLWQLYRLPVVYLTAHTDEATVARARATAPLGYLAKPVTPGSLRATLTMALERQELQRQLEEREEWLHFALRATGEGLIITDSEGHIVFMNSAAEDLVETPRSIARGQFVDEAMRIIGADGKVHRLQESAAFSDVTQQVFMRGEIQQTDRRCAVLITIAALKRTNVGGGAVIVLRDISGLNEGGRNPSVSLPEGFDLADLPFSSCN